MDWYNPPSGTWLGTAVVFGLFVAAVVTLLRSSASALDHSKAVRLSCAYALTGMSLLIATVVLFWVRTDFAHDDRYSVWGDSWGMVHLPQGFVLFAGVGIIGCIGLIAHAASTHKSVLGVLLGSLALFGSVSLAADSQLMVFATLSDIWALMNTVAWICFLVLLVATVAYTVTKRVQAYGQRCYDRGRLDKLDATDTVTLDKH